MQVELSKGEIDMILFKLKFELELDNKELDGLIKKLEDIVNN